MTIDDFDGLARLFPLPDLVMFPQVVQPLRIFEPRYLEMLHEALETDRMIAMATLMPGWEPGSEDNPPIHRSICLGHIMSEAEADDGSYNIFLAGVARGVITQECESDASFRRAEVELLPDVYSGDATSTVQLQDELVTRFRNLMPANKTTDDLLSRILSDDCSLGMLVDVISFALPLKQPIKLELLSEGIVEARARLLINSLAESERRPNADPDRVFPPEFSLN